MVTGVEAVSALAASADANAALGTVASGDIGGAGQSLAGANGAGSAVESFASYWQRELGAVGSNVKAAEGALGDLAAGRSVQLHEVMIAIERAQLSVQAFVQIRNKLVESYQDLMRMQL